SDFTDGCHSRGKILSTKISMAKDRVYYILFCAGIQEKNAKICPVPHIIKSGPGRFGILFLLLRLAELTQAHAPAVDNRLPLHPDKQCRNGYRYICRHEKREAESIHKLF